MRISRLIGAAALIGNLLFSQVIAQGESAEPSPASELWVDGSVRMKIPGGLSASLSHELRYDDNMSRRYLTAPELSLRYELNRWWHMEGGYRHETERDNEAVFQDRYRIFANTRFIAKYRPTTLELRIQWQEEFRQAQDDGTSTRHILRTRVKAKFRRVPVISPHTSLEMFQRIDGRDKDVTSGTIQKVRLGLGVEWQRGPIEVNTRYYLVLPNDDPEEAKRHILSVGVRLDLEPWK